MNNQPGIPTQSSAVQMPSPRPKKPLSSRAKRWIIISAVCSLVVVIAMIVGLTIIYNTWSGKPSADYVAKPLQSGAFLDSRYKTGSRTLKLEGATARVLGVTKDKKQMAVWTSSVTRLSPVGMDRPSGLLSVYEVATAKLLTTTSVESCSNISEDDTVLCSAYKEKARSSTDKHYLRTIDVKSGSELKSAEIPMAPMVDIKLLGRSDGTDIISFQQKDDKLGATNIAFYVMSLRDDGLPAWTLRLIVAMKEYEPACLLLKDKSSITCSYTTLVKDDKQESGVAAVKRIASLGTKDGKTVGKTDAPGTTPPIILSDGWLTDRNDDVPKTVEDVRKMDASMLVHGTKGDVKKFSFPVGGGGLIPQPQSGATSPLVTYSFDAMSQAQTGRVYVVDGDGKVVLRGKRIGSGMNDNQSYKRADNGKKIFQGLMLGVSADAKVILGKAPRLTEGDYRLIDTETGKVIQGVDLETSSNLGAFSIVDGIIVGTNPSIVFLPGR